MWNVQAGFSGCGATPDSLGVRFLGGHGKVPGLLSSGALAVFLGLLRALISAGPGHLCFSNFFLLGKKNRSLILQLCWCEYEYINVTY